MSAPNFLPQPGLADAALQPDTSDEVIELADASLVFDTSGWLTALPDLAQRVEIVRKAINAKVDGQGAITFLFTSDGVMAQLNRDWRGKDRPTNVLSFPAFAPAAGIQAGDASPLGDIAIGLEICSAEAKTQGKTLADHVTHLLVHGILHLLGYDHETAQDALEMEALEREILSRLGIADPYQAHAD